MRILVDCGDYKCSNMGDVAMLQAAVSRLERTFPGARIDVVTDSPSALARHCPEARAVPVQGKRAAIGRHPFFQRVARVLPWSAGAQLMVLDHALRKRHGANRSEEAGAACEAFLEALSGADLLVISGQAGLNDHVKPHALSLLGLLEEARRRGKPTAMMSQGIGPLCDSELQAAARGVLPQVGFLSLREERTGPDLLKQLAVSRSRWLFSGDDAVETAYGERAEGPGDAIGINLRVARSAGVETAMIAALGPVLRRLARTYRAELAPLPITRHPHLLDAATIAGLLDQSISAAGGTLDTPLSVIRQARRCRVVVTGAYHAAVFALAQGIPVVCLAKSEYFFLKFQGLAASFGAGCELVDLEEARLDVRLESAVARAWKSAETVRAGLLREAEHQTALAAEAYRGLDRLVTRRSRVCQA